MVSPMPEPAPRMTLADLGLHAGRTGVETRLITSSGPKVPMASPRLRPLITVSPIIGCPVVVSPSIEPPVVSESGLRAGGFHTPLAVGPTVVSLLATSLTAVSPDLWWLLGFLNEIEMLSVQGLSAPSRPQRRVWCL